MKLMKSSWRTTGLDVSEVLKILIPYALPVPLLDSNIKEITMMYKMIYVPGYPLRSNIIMIVKNWKPPKCQQQEIG